MRRVVGTSREHARRQAQRVALVQQLLLGQQRRELVPFEVTDHG